MGLGLGTRLAQGMEQRQEMVLAPRMLQAIEVLSLPATDLERWLQDEAERNEALVVEGPSVGDESPWIEPSRSAAARSRASDDHRALLEAQPAPERSLPDVVEDEIASRDLAPDLAAWIRFLAGCLDEGGLLTLADDRLLELAEDDELPGAGTRRGAGLLADAIAQLQQFEPAGLGARSSVEALLLQLDPADEDYGLLCALLEDFLVDLSCNRRGKVAERLGLELGELERLLSVLERLETRPARAFTGAPALALSPDVVAHVDADGAISVELARGALPTVTVDPDLAELHGSLPRGDEAKGYLQTRLEKARWTAEAVEMRGTTLLRVASAALGGQREFLRRGPGALVPLSMGDVAESLGLATSTVSRAVSGKHVQTPWGIVPLRILFQSDSGGSATDAVRDAVARIVKNEDASEPLSDDAIAAALAREGHAVARRTVAKHRRDLGIPSSYRRRR